MSKQYNIKGRGYSARCMYEAAPGHWSVPMYRNRDDASMGIFEIKANHRMKAFSIAQKACREEMRS